MTNGRLHLQLHQVFLLISYSFPLQENICSLNEDIDVPEYVKSDPEMRISPDQIVNVLSDWPQEPANDLDVSQWEALHHILTKRLAIIQGPPGTGKTHVSVTALKLLLQNRNPRDPPIIVAAHTNHALDQLLNHISEVVPDYVRLGGRSIDENVRKRTLYEVRKSISIPPLFGGALGRAYHKLKIFRENIENLLRVFTMDSTGPLPATFFRDQKIISSEQYDALCNGAEGWTNSNLEEQADPIISWVGDMLFENSVTYRYEDRGYEEDEMDLEYEQLREMEQEKGIFDDDFETLKGPFVPLKENVRGRSNIDDELIEYLSIDNLWDVPPQNRGTIYNVLCRIAKEKLLSTFREHLKQYNRSVTERFIGKWEEDYAILKNTKLVGMTTTGLSKYRALVSALKPKIVMIEEAAETIEAPVTAACVESLEHLILVGDHKQLQGSCSVTDLEGDPFFLNMSMFERLVQNDIDYRTLLLQRRMVPEIRRLLTPIYSNLKDHPSVNNLMKVPGMGDIRSFLFCHQWPENSDSLSSRYNAQEAEMVVTFFLHLFFSGVDPSEITVLTFYNGQRKKILKLLKENRHLQSRHLKVNTVDSYQGEENDIVLLSLVRSNERGEIGFLSIENRVCVALSRARRGFYIFGDAQKLASKDPLWWEMVKMMGEGDEESRRIGFHLPLTCDKHQNKEFVSKPEDIKELNGGCRLPCETVLGCGHPCPVKCHGFDHALIQCKERCGKALSCGHICREACTAPTCSCHCGYKTTKASSLAKPSKGSSIQSSSPSKANVPEPRRQQQQQQTFKTDKERIQAFQKYAQGGSREHDRMLDKKFSAETTENILARLDAEESANLFTEQQQQPAQDLDVRVLSPVGDEESGGARTRWVQSFTPAIPTVEQQSVAVKGDLIDLD
jgi:helicase required for RNAi-mediated heterochromatin assembly 1